MAETYDTVTSEVHHFSKEESLDPSRGAVLSRFDFVYPPYMVVDKIPILSPVIDSDGDLQVTRKKDLDKKEGVVLIEHQSATTLDLVGEQVWRGALFMADFILNNPDIFRDAHILEVASGVGLTSIVAAMLAKQVIISDIDRGDILELIDRNIKRNTDLLKASVEVKEIDFFNHATIDEIMDVKKSVSILLAADVVYHDQLTDAFFRTILRLMSDPPNKSLYVALEKRFVFTQEDMDTVAPCYEHFLQGLEWLASQNLSQIDWTMEQLSTDFEQYFTYERTRHLVLWKIQATLK
ncbi:methyltransferase-like protein 22 isoform X5 [Procambarus clarkii]|uniref:methyltransferase-like protein 22 isoform X5 n=1 Tax=Procambarus clarkii TaxID=6728 RepID=UPI0037438178